MTSRRHFITVLGGAAAAWPVAGRAQQSEMPVIGFLSIASPDILDNRLRAFRDGLGEAGYIEGRNVAIEYRWARGQSAHLPALATDLVERGVRVIVATGGAAARAAKSTTSTTPIVFYVGSNPVGLGLIASLNRPGGNLTGMSNMAGELEPKRLELLHEVIPTATVVAALVNPTIAGAENQLRRLRDAADALHIELHTLEATAERDFDLAFLKIDKLRIGALVVASDLFFTSQFKQLAALTLRRALPAIFSFREFVTAGGLMSYGSNSAHMYRQVGNYTGRILKGEQPADLPAQQSTKVELVINLKTAKTFGLTIPLPLLGRADEVIE